MNIFVLHPNPKKAARWHADQHVVKMILESVQMLYTAHWSVAYPFLLTAKSPLALSKMQKGFPIPPSIRSAPYNNSNQRGYRPVHIHHPCTKWVQSSKSNYHWLCQLALCLCAEHTFRWPDSPPHSCAEHVKWLLTHPPALPNIPLTQFAEAMPDEYKRGDPVKSYRTFYRTSKTERGITQKYTNRHKPHWLNPYYPKQHVFLQQQES